MKCMREWNLKVSLQAGEAGMLGVLVLNTTVNHEEETVQGQDPGQDIVKDLLFNPDIANILTVG